MNHFLSFDHRGTVVSPFISVGSALLIGVPIAVLIHPLYFMFEIRDSGM